MKGPVAESIQIALESLDPITAADLRVEAGGSVSLATAAAEAGIIEHNAATKTDLAMHSSVYQKQRKAEAEDFERRMLSEMDEAATKLQLARGYDASQEQPLSSYSWQQIAIQKNRQAWSIDHD